MNERRAPHPANDLNELPGEEWLYFTKSVWTTAYPSELGHARRRAHGANKPPRLMARLIEFFTRTGELVLDPFAGVGGTLLGRRDRARPAAGDRHRARPPLGRRVSPRRSKRCSAEHDGAGPRLADLGAADPGGPRGFDPSGIELRGGDARAVLPTLAAASVDFVATDPPYNVQLPMTMAGGKLAETHANRRTDYAMRSDLPEDLANLPDYAAYLDAMSEVLCEVHRVLRPGRYAVADRPRRLPGRPLPVHRGRPRGARRPRRASSPRATSRGTRPGRGCGRTATRGRSCPTSCTSTSSCCARRPSPEGARRRPAR